MPIVDAFVDACFSAYRFDSENLLTITAKFYSAFTKSLLRLFPENDVLTVRFKVKSHNFFAAPNPTDESKEVAVSDEGSIYITHPKN